MLKIHLQIYEVLTIFKLNLRRLITEKVKSIQKLMYIGIIYYMGSVNTYLQLSRQLSTFLALFKYNYSVNIYVTVTLSVMYFQLDVLFYV